MGKGLVVSFYSYKGGVGRTFALANIAVLLSKWEYKVLCVDWDLGAPGLHRYFQALDKEAGSPDTGLLELIQEYADAGKAEWRSYIQTLSHSQSKVPLSFICAGREDDSYPTRLQKIEWEKLYSETDFGSYLEAIRKEWIEEYDFVLIDSRTGITDIGGISTIQLPDVLCFFFSANHQSFEGALRLVRRIQQARDDLVFEKGGIIPVPIVSRFDSRREHKEADKWLKIFEKDLKDCYSTWVPKGLKIKDLIIHTQIPYVPYWSFGEKLSVLESNRGDPESINYYFETLAALFAHRFDNAELLLDNRDSFVDQVSVGKPTPGPDRAPEKRQIRIKSLDIITRHGWDEWCAFVDELTAPIIDQLVEWKKRTESERRPWEEAVKEAIEICLPGFVPILASVVKGEEEYWRQSVAILRKLLMLRLRMGGGSVTLCDIGENLPYIAGSIGMAVAAKTRRLRFIQEWMALQVPVPHSSGQQMRPWHDVASLHSLPPDVLGRSKIDPQNPFGFLLEVSDSDYLHGFFPNKPALRDNLFLSNLLQNLTRFRYVVLNKDGRKDLENGIFDDYIVLPLWSLMPREDFQLKIFDIFGTRQDVINFTFPEGLPSNLDFWAFWKNWKEMIGRRMFSYSHIPSFTHFDWLLLPGEPDG